MEIYERENKHGQIKINWMEYLCRRIDMNEVTWSNGLVCDAALKWDRYGESEKGGRERRGRKGDKR